MNFDPILIEVDFLGRLEIEKMKYNGSKRTTFQLKECFQIACKVCSEITYTPAMEDLKNEILT